MNIYNRISPLILFLFSLEITGCATMGPQISTQEIEQARKDLQRKALTYKFSQQIRLNRIGYRLISQVQLPRDGEPKPYVGLLLADLSKTVKEFYQLDTKRGVVVTGVIGGSPAEQAGFQAGDVLIKIGKAEPQSASEALQVLRKFTPGEAHPIEVQTKAEVQVLDLMPTPSPYWIRFMTGESETVNAFAVPEQIVVTYGMLRFIHSDDELAVVIGHELAHLIQGHIAKSMGSNLLAMITGLAMGIGSEIVLSGSGDPMSRLGSGVIQAQFSKDFEREADYIGLQYVHAAGFDIHAGIAVWERFGVEIPVTLSSNFLSTHPSSPERMIRVQKVVEEILKPADSEKARTSSGEEGRRS